MYYLCGISRTMIVIRFCHFGRLEFNHNHRDLRFVNESTNDLFEHTSPKEQARRKSLFIKGDLAITKDEMFETEFPGLLSVFKLVLAVVSKPMSGGR